MKMARRARFAPTTWPKNICSPTAITSMMSTRTARRM
jgi:hypothetical protein